MKSLTIVVIKEVVVVDMALAEAERRSPRSNVFPVVIGVGYASIEILNIQSVSDCDGLVSNWKWCTSVLVSAAPTSEPLKWS